MGQGFRDSDSSRRERAQRPGRPHDKPESELVVACRRHLDFVRKNCPYLLPEDEVTPGTPTEPVPVRPEEATALLRAAVKDAVRSENWLRGSEPAPEAVVWADGTDRLLVHLDSLRVSTDHGLVSVTVDVGCDQLRAQSDRSEATVQVDLVVGTAERPTGLLAAAPTPQGPAVVVDRWRDALVAFAWQALLDVAAALSAMAGSDTDGAGLVPTRWTASRDGVAIGPQARHPFDRARATSRRVTSSPLSAPR